jgi:hypothetical protein
MTAEVNAMKAQIYGIAAERAEVESKIDAQNQKERKLKDKSEDL